MAEEYRVAEWRKSGVRKSGGRVACGRVAEEWRVEQVSAYDLCGMIIGGLKL